MTNTFDSVVGKTVLRDRPQSLYFAYDLNPDCTSRGEPVIQILDAPKNGTATVANARDYTNFTPPNERVVCNKVKREGKRLTYRPNPGFVGSDSMVIDAIFPSGTVRHRRYVITVR